MSIIRQLCSDFAKAASPAIIPSPVEVFAKTVLLALDYKDACVEHVRHVRAEQIAFSQRIEAIGISRLMHMSPHEVLERYGCS